MLGLHKKIVKLSKLLREELGFKNQIC